MSRGGGRCRARVGGTCYRVTHVSRALGERFMRLRGTTESRRGAALLAVAVLAAGCSTGTGGDAEQAADAPGAVKGDAVAEDTPEVTVGDNVSRRGVAVDTTVEVTAQDGTLKQVRVFGG